MKLCYKYNTNIYVAAIMGITMVQSLQDKSTFKYIHKDDKWHNLAQTKSQVFNSLSLTALICINIKILTKAF